MRKSNGVRRCVLAALALSITIAACGSSAGPIGAPVGSDPIAFDESAVENTVPTTRSSAPAEDSARRSPASFTYFGGRLECSDGKHRTGMLFWGAQRLPSHTETDSYEAFEELVDEKQPGGFFGFASADYGPTFTMSPVAERPLQSRAAQRRVEITLGEFPAPVVIYPNVFDEPVALDCMFHGVEFGTFSAYRGDFECTEIDADRSIVFKERAPGKQIFLAWIPSNGPDYILAYVAKGPAFFNGRGIDTNEIDETAIVDFTFDEQVNGGRLTMTGKLLYENDPIQSCAGEWDIWEQR